MFILEAAETITCGGMDINTMIPAFTAMIVNAIKIFIPILLIFFGMIDLGKAVMSNDEKEMKGAQTKFIRRCLYAVIVFFIVAVVQLIFGMLNSADSDSEALDPTSCIDCFIRGPENCK